VDVVAWQRQNHEGFLPAFISSIQHAPIRDQHEQWRLIGSRLAAQRDQPSTETIGHGLREGNVLLVLGKNDDVVLAEEIATDAREVFGEEYVDVRILEGGHDLPIVHAEKVTETVLGFWCTSVPLKQ
jgi:hypothetical protein